MGDSDKTDLELWSSFKEYSKTFSAATNLLPKEVRLPIATLYSFCRRVDDIADNPSNTIDAQEALAKLDYFEASIRTIISNNQIPEGDILWSKLFAVNQQWRMSIVPFLELINGARFDLRREKINTLDDLVYYSNLVAGSIGAMMLPFLTTGDDGVWDQIEFDLKCEELDQPSRDLGIAMQITNILRDVGEDFKLLGRVYIPSQFLEAREIQISEILDGPIPKRYAMLVEELMEHAELRYESGLASIKELDWRVRPGIRSAAKMYREILNEIRKNEYDNLSKRAYTSKITKVRLSTYDSYEKTKIKYRLKNA